MFLKTKRVTKVTLFVLANFLDTFRKKYYSSTSKDQLKSIYNLFLEGTLMALNTTQIMVLHWFYNCHSKGQEASYNGTLEHFGQVLKIREPMNVLLSLLEMGFISVDKSKMQASITKAGLQHYESLKNK